MIINLMDIYYRGIDAVHHCGKNYAPCPEYIDLDLVCHISYIYFGRITCVMVCNNAFTEFFSL